MGSLYINAFYKDGQYYVDIITYIVITIYRLSEPQNLVLTVKILKHLQPDSVAIVLDSFNFNIVYNTLEDNNLCTWPIIVLNNYIVSGLCSVTRQICRLSEKEGVKKLLGFREACLVACAESSVWTKFCEIDIIQSINNILHDNFIENNHFIMPEEILKFENHLSQPVKIHNIYKIARDNHNDQKLNSSIPRKDLKVPHKYAEGPYITLADLILYPCIQIFFRYCKDHYQLSVESKIPLIYNWFNKVKDLSFPQLVFSLQISVQACKDMIILVPEINKVSLYKSDATRAYRVKHTKQYKIQSSLNLLEEFRKDIKNDILPFGYKNTFNWGGIPLDANPKGGALPAKRADRKCNQLENLVKATIEIVGEKRYKIVDFCSGSGHLGILVALVLPNCEIILVENKETSLARARETISKLNLTNVLVVQSNLDYFIGKFDLGIALHACGVATDLVLQMCINNKAHFICCPCCYGGIKNCHEVSYPRSAKFQLVFNNFESQYLNLAHAADQTHGVENAKTQQGYFCMDFIDTDRKFYAEDFGYKVYLGKLQPESCTNKNNLLVGVYTKNKII